MISFFKKVFSKKSPEENKNTPIKLGALLAKLINLSIDKEKLKARFPEGKREAYSKDLEEGLKALNKNSKLMRVEQGKVNKIKIINLLKLVVTYGDSLEITGVDVEKK
jgi:hypothetical protein